MKDQYFGDKRDYLKYHVLETLLSRVPSLRQLTCFWMLTPNDNSHQGNVALLPSAELPELTSFLNSHLQDDKRTVSLLRSYFEDRGIKYNPVGDAGPPYFSASNRSSYFRNVPDDFLQGALIFIDPDNGISFKQSNTKQVSWSEINELWKRADDDAVFAIVQFAQRKPEFFPQRARELEQHLGRTIFWIQEYPFAIYFCAKSGRNDDLILSSLRDVASIGPNRVVGNSSTWKTHESWKQQAKVYLLWHSHDEESADFELLGVYSLRIPRNSNSCCTVMRIAVARLCE